MCVCTLWYRCVQVFLVRRIIGKDAGKLYAMKVLKKASLKGKRVYSIIVIVWIYRGVCLLANISSALIGNCLIYWVLGIGCHDIL